MTSTRARRARSHKGTESIRRDVLQEKALSLKARGLISLLVSLPDDWECHGVDGIAAKFCDKDGPHAINEGLKELEAAGLFARLKRQGEGGKWQWLWAYSDDPAEVAEEIARWETQGFRIVASSGPRTAKPPVSGKSQHGSMSGKSMHGPSVHGELPDIESHSPVPTGLETEQRDREISAAPQRPAAAGRSDRSTAPAPPARAELALVHPAPNTPVVVTGRDVVAAWVDTYRGTVGAEPTKQQIGQVGREAKQLLDAGNRPDRVIYAARSIASRGKALVTAEFADLSAAARGRNTARPAPRRSTTDDRVQQGLDLVAHYAALEREEAAGR